MKKNYWLVKTEPGTYSFADLEREGKTAWSGVGNPLAKKHLRAMCPGDEVFVYHTGNEKQIVGRATVLQAGDEPILAVGKRLPQAVTLIAIKAHKRFAGWELVRRGRLSVMPAQVEIWQAVLELAD